MSKLLSVFIALFFFCSSMAFAAVDLNSASQSDLEALPGIGASTAKAIVAARPFHSIDDLKNVKGIGTAKFAKLAPLVSVGASIAPAAAIPAASNIPVAAPRAEAPALRAATPPAANTASRAAKDLANGERININTASVTDLARLPGIGPKKAEAIVAARPFQSPEDIMKVKGIKQGIFAKIKNNISVQ